MPAVSLLVESPSGLIVKKGRFRSWSDGRDPLFLGWSRNQSDDANSTATSIHSRGGLVLSGINTTNYVSEIYQNRDPVL